jgi:hypothetical protein
MTFQDFLEKYNGKQVDFDGVYGFQCMDLMHQYIVDVLGLTDGRILSAYFARYVFENFDTIFGHEYFERIDNTPDNMPIEGDIVFYKAPLGKFTDDYGVIQYAGHVAVCVSATLNKMTLFEQNYDAPICHINEHTYGYCLGWLRYKGNAPQNELEKCVSDRNAHWNFIIQVASKLGVETSQTIILAEIDKLITYEDKVHQQEIQLNEVQAKAQEFATQAENKAQELVNLQQTIKDMQKKLETAIKDNSELSRALSDLKTQAAVNPNKPWWQTVFDLFFKGR